MKRIVPHLWFDKDAKQAAEFYVGLFPDSKIIRTNVLNNTPSGDVDMVEFTLAGLPFSAISAGPEFQLNPSISLIVLCESENEISALWESLMDGGTALMPLGEYPFSSRFGWAQDRFGLSWQLLLTDVKQPQQKIMPYLLFAGPARGKAEDAAQFYTDVFRNSGLQMHKPSTEQPEYAADSATGLHSFHLLGQSFYALDHSMDADFTFNEAFSLMVYCDTQKEVDYFWETLSAVPQAEACGWLKDRYGVSWQIVPVQMVEMMESGSQEQIARLAAAFLQMKKLDIAAMQKAYLGA